MQLEFSVPFQPGSDDNSFFDPIPARPAVFALFPDRGREGSPYLGRTADLRRRLARLLGKPREFSRKLSLRDVTRHVEYQLVGSTFEAQWLLYLLNRSYYPKVYRQRLRLKPPPLLKVNLSNRFPRCYPTRRLTADGSLYYGPFPSRLAAERFAAEFLDFFKVRRCVEELDPDPSHPGCIYSQMSMCLAPCFRGCTDDEYAREVGRVVAFLDGAGQPLIRDLEAERARASEALEFEQAEKTHRKLQKLHEVLRQKSDIARNLAEFHAVVVERGAEAKSIVFFRVAGGELRGPLRLSLDENVSLPKPLDEQLASLLASAVAPPRAKNHLPSWEHLSLLARWYYSSFRQGELVMLAAPDDIPHARLIRLCRKLLAANSSQPG